MYPHKFRQRMYLPMFGRLDIEKLLLEIHDQLIAGKGLLRFLIYSNFQSLVLEI